MGREEERGGVMRERKGRRGVEGGKEGGREREKDGDEERRRMRGMKREEWRMKRQSERRGRTSRYIYLLLPEPEEDLRLWS